MFYVTGLPRSRTAWMARVLTHGKSRCLHDALGRFGVKEAVALARDLDAGISDSGLALVHEILPTARWLVIQRDFAYAADSFLRMPPYPFETQPRSLDGMRQIEASLKEVERSQECRVVQFDSLDTESVVRGAWDFLVGDREPWCPWHWDEMRHLRVTVKPETYQWRS